MKLKIYPALASALFMHYVYFSCIFFNISSICFLLVVGMLPVLLLAGLILALSIPGTTSESATLRFVGETDFVVNESSSSVVRLVLERVGDPVNVTALVLVRHTTSSLCVHTHHPVKSSVLSVSHHLAGLLSCYLHVQ